MDTSKKYSWDVHQREKLLRVATAYDSDLRSESTYTANSVVIDRIHRDFNEDGCGKSAILYQLADMNFFSQREQSKKNGIFYRQKKEIALHNYKIGPNYPPTNQIEIESIINFFLEKVKLDHENISELCEVLSSEFGRTGRNIQKILFDNNVIEVTPSRYLMLAPTFLTKATDQTTMEFRERQAPHDVLSDIIHHRNAAAIFYRSQGHPLPALIRSTDGTGSGKSYAVFDQYIKEANRSEPGIRHRNLLFITPHKTQILSVDNDLLDKARAKKIPILPVLGRDDLTNLEFVDWVTKESNRSKYERWIKSGISCPFLKAHLQSLKYVIKQIRFFETQLTDLQSAIQPEQLKEQLDSLKYQILKILEKLCLATVNQSGTPVTPTDLLLSNTQKDLLRLEILSLYMPFERALMEPCILLATTAKADTSMYLLSGGNRGKYGVKRVPLDELLGGSEAPSESLVSNWVARSDRDHREFLREEFFASDEKNLFRKSGVAFTMVLDEEHEAYHVLSKEGKVTLLDSNSNLPHVLSSIYRAFKSIDGLNSDIASTRPLYEVTNKFFSTVESLLAQHCDLSEGNSLKSLLSLFESNIGYIQIEKQDVEQVIQIARNVFSFTPKRFFNEVGLKRIHIVGCDNNTHCRLYFSPESDTNPTLYDLHQVIMALLAAAAELNNEDFLNMLGTVDSNSQNSPLSRFIRAARSNRDDVQYMFDRANDENIIVDRFFTYFQPKTVFSLESRQRVEYVDPRLNDFVYVDFRLDLLKALPEVSIMRALHNTRNAIFCLSATTGFAEIYNGNYNHNMLRHYGERGADNLDYRVVTRSQADLPTLDGLRNARAKIRDVTFFPFSSVGKSIKDEPFSGEFQNTYKHWRKKLNPNPAILRNIFHIREFDRQLEAILLAAYEEKNTLTLALTGNIRKVFRDYTQLTQDRCRVLRRCSRNVHDIYDFTPFNNKITLRLVFFHADLVKEIELNKFTVLSTPTQRLVFVAPYGAAGTGLNNFVTYINSNFKEDFTRLVLINTPFYSEVLKKDEGFNTLENWLTLMKYYSDSDVRSEIVCLKDFDVNLVNGPNYLVLMREHQMSIFKKLIQALGRVERADSVMSSEIYLSSDLLDVAMLQFAQLSCQESNRVVLGSLSLLNQKLYEYCKNKVKCVTFSDQTQRDDFERLIISNQRKINKFFEDTLMKEIARARSEGIFATQFNEDLRSIDCVINPASWISKLKKSEVVRSNPYYQSIIDSFYLKKEDSLEGITFCQSPDGRGLSDMIGGNVLYQAANRVLPHYNKLYVNEEGDFWSRLNKLIDLQDNSFQLYVPVPALLPLIKGNVGEYLLDGLLNQVSVNALSLEDVFEKLNPICYELYDRYVETRTGLVCLDAKNWSSGFDRTEQAVEAHQNSIVKMDTIRRLLGHQYPSITFVYINTRFEHNPLNLMPESDGAGAYYLNLLKLESSYMAAKGKRHSLRTDRITLNKTLLELLAPSNNS